MVIDLLFCFVFLLIFCIEHTLPADQVPSFSVTLDV